MVSVIMPVYNNEKFVADAIQSVLNQTMSDFELIIIDDGSTDGTKKVIESFSDERIKYHYQENAGPGAGRNNGMRLAKGEFIAFIDSDDMYKPNKLERQVQFLRENPQYGVVYCETEVIDAEGRFVANVKADSNYTNKEDMHAFMFFRQVMPAVSAMMIRRKCYDDGFKYHSGLFRGEDYYFVLNLSEKFAFCYMNENLYKYRKHASNLTNLQTGMEQGEIKVLSRFTDEEIAERINRSNFSEMDKQLLIAKVFIKMNKFDKAREVLEIAEKKYKSEIISFYLGNCSYQSKDYMDAVIYYQEAVEINSKMAEAYNNMGCAYMGLGNEKEAFKAFTQAHHIRKEYNDSVYNIKQLSNGAKEYKLTMRELRKSLMVYN